MPGTMFDMFAKALNGAFKVTQPWNQQPKDTGTQKQPTYPSFGGGYNFKPTTPQKGTEEYYAYEVGRAQSAWDQYGKNNRSDLQSGAHNWADTMRAEAKAKGYNLDKYGEMNQHGSNFVNFYNRYADPNSPAGNYDPSKAGQQLWQPTTQQAPKKNSDILFDLFMNSLNPQQSAVDQMRKDAEAEALRLYNNQKGLIDGTLEQINRDLGVQLGGIKNRVADARSTLEDTTTQAWLESRQSMSNRGLGGSGLASDADTRLLLDRQRQMSGIERDAALQSNVAENQAQGARFQLKHQLAQISPEILENDLFQKAMASSASNNHKQAELYLQAMSQLTGYDYATIKDQMDYQTKKDQLNLDTNKFLSDKYFSENGTWKDRADNAFKNNNLLAQIKQWSEENKLKADGNSLGWAELQHKASYDSQMIARFSAAATNDQAKTTLSGLNSQLDAISGQIKGYLDNDTPVPSALTDAYNNVMNQVSRVLGTGGVDLGKVNLGGMGNGYNDPLDPFGIRGALNGMGKGGNTGGGVNTKSDGRYTNLWKTQKNASQAPGYQAFQGHLNSAMQNTGVPADWAPYLTELFGRESTWNPNAANPESTARGYAQFLDTTRANYRQRYGIEYDTPINQLILGIHYVKDRYGDPVKALQFWDKNNWY